MSSVRLVALVTGATGGIGKAIVAEFLHAGGKVIATGRDTLALNALRRTLDPLGTSLRVIPADVAVAKDRQHLTEACDTWNGGINVIVNNAGVADFGMFADASAASMERAFAVNVLGPMHLTRALLPILQRHSRAHIVNIGSVFGTIAYPGQATYSATKFALRGFSEALRRELADSTVSVHHVAPRATRTHFNSPAVEELNTRLNVTTDPPERVAVTVLRALLSRRDEVVIGWPEKLFARLNALFPRLVDSALRRQLPIIREQAALAKSAPLPRSIEHTFNRRVL